MPVQGITNGYGPVIGQPETSAADISRMDFMTLLVAQIRNQDPMSPMDNAEFTSQLTQFTMLEEMESMNLKLEDNLLVGQTINNTAMLGLVGKQVTVEGNRTWVDAGEVSENVVAADGPATAIIEVTDASGHVVATFEKNLDKGLNDVTWDGRMNSGDLAADGVYSISVTLEDGGSPVAFTTLMTGPVEGLRYENNAAVVMVGGLEFFVSDIYKVS